MSSNGQAVAFADDISRLPTAFLDALDVGVLVLDRELRVTYANPYVDQLIGLDLVGRTGFDSTWQLVREDGSLIPIQETPGMLAISTGQPQRGAVLGVRLDPADPWMWVRLSAVPRLDASGNVESVVITVGDISTAHRRKEELEDEASARAAELARSVDRLEREVEHRQIAEVALARREAMHREILSTVSEGVLIRGRDGSLQYVNAAAQQILGMDRDELDARGTVSDDWDLVDSNGDPLPPHRMPVAVTQRTGQPCRGVLLGVRRGDRSRAWIIVNTKHLGDAGSVVATFSDVTRLREANIALERSRERFERVTRTVPGVLYQAIQGREGSLYMPFVSAAAKDVIGLGAAEIVARPERLLDCIDALSRQRLALAAQQACADGRVFETEVLIKPPGQPARWIRNRAVPQTVGDDVIWSGVAFDVTDERKLGEQVRAAQRREAVGSVTAGIAHNFNNALAVLIPNLEHSLVAADGDQRQLLLESLQTARAAADLVRQLMLVASSGLVGDRAPLDIVPVVRETLTMVRRLARGRVTVRGHLVPPSAYIDSSPGALQQVLLNLCINAQDALRGIEDGVVDISLRTDEETRRAVLSVRDNGCGMDADTLRRVGEPFFTTKSPGSGTGLGLATVYATVQELGGSIECNSTQGQGCEFVIRLPMCDAPAETAASKHPSGQFAAVARILVVDDEALVRSAVARSLSKAGHVVEQCSSGAEALQRIRNAQVSYDLMLLDLSMPGMSGESVLGTLGIEQPDLPVVVLTGFVEDRDAIAHAREVLLKPVSSKEIGRAVSRVLST